MADRGALSGNELAVVSIIVVGGITLLKDFAPKLAELRAADPNDPTTAAQLRTGEAAAVGGLLLAGGAAAWLTGRYEPLVLAAIVAGAGVAFFEATFAS